LWADQRQTTSGVGSNGGTKTLQFPIRYLQEPESPQLLPLVKSYKILHVRTPDIYRSPVVVPVVVVPLLVPPVIISLIHTPAKSRNIVLRIVPPVLNILRDILDLLHLLASPARGVLWEVLDVVDSVVEAVLHAVVEVLDAPDLLAGPVCSVLGQVGDVVAEFVDAVFDGVLVALKVVL